MCCCCGRWAALRPRSAGSTCRSRAASGAPSHLRAARSARSAGDFVSGRLLHDAARLTLRSGAGPFRSLGRLGMRPRPYQLVPLIMALRLDPVRAADRRRRWHRQDDRGRPDRPRAARPRRDPSPERALPATPVRPVAARAGRRSSRSTLWSCAPAPPPRWSAACRAATSASSSTTRSPSPASTT